jgi:hypothetical protein
VSAVAAGGDSLRLSAGALREGTRSQLPGTLTLIATAGMMVAGCRLRADPPKK